MLKTDFFQQLTFYLIIFALRYAFFYNTLSKLSVQLLEVCERKLQLNFLEAVLKILMLPTKVI